MSAEALNRKRFGRDTVFANRACSVRARSRFSGTGFGKVLGRDSEGGNKRAEVLAEICGSGVGTWCGDRVL